jgi:nucleoside-diphosphate-sugar epimerase
VERLKMVRVFITGAGGYIGGVVAEKALEAGHTVVGLTRSKEGAAKLKSKGIEPVVGDLTSLSVLAEEARRANAVIHLAFNLDFGQYKQALQTDLEVIKTFTQVLAETNKILLGTSSSAVYKDTGDGLSDEETPLGEVVPGVDRRGSELAYIQAATQGIRSAVLRLSLYVYGRNGSIYIPAQIESAKRDGVARYIGAGLNKLTVVHVEDVASAYVQALQAPFAPGSIFNVGDSSDSPITMKKVAEAIAERLSIQRVESITPDEAASVWSPLLASRLAMSNQFSSKKAEDVLGWKPQAGRSILRTIVEEGRD